MPSDEISADPLYLSVDLSDGEARVRLGDYYTDAPPPEQWREICQCEKNYVPVQGALCPDCALMHFKATQMAHELAGDPWPPASFERR